MDTAANPEPSRIGRYQLIAEIGRGSTGVVYQAYEPLLERTVALKVLAPEVTHQPGMATLLHREAISAARLRHLNIALLYEFGQAGDSAFLAMEYIPGTSLRSILAAEPLPIRRTLGILSQIAQALDYMHRVGVFHRDIKPGNIMVGPGDHAVLIDFGLAYATDGSTSTAHGTLLGTPTYLAPEQAAGEQSDARSDQYALAVVAYEMLTGTVPFPRRHPIALVYAHMHEAPDPPSERHPALPQAVDAVLLRALAKTPQERYPSVAAFVAALRDALGRPSLGRQGRSSRRRYRQTAGFALAGLILLVLLRQNTLPAPAPTAMAPVIVTGGEPLPEQIVWSYSSGLVGGSGLSLADNTLVSTSLDGALLALQADSGALKWQIPATGGSFGAPHAEERFIFVGTDRSEVMALSPASGGLIWRTPVIGSVQHAPTYASGYVIVSTGKGYLYVLEAASGKVIWSRPLAPGAQAAVVHAGHILIAADRVLFSLDLQHGVIAWEFMATSGITTLPAIVNEGVIVGTERGLLHGLSLVDGQEQWRYQARGAFSAAPVAASNTLFVVDRAGGVTALRLATGTELWHRDTGAAINASPLLVDATLFVATSNGSVYALDIQHGGTLAEVRLGGSIDAAPISGTGLVYVRADQIYALGSSPK